MEAPTPKRSAILTSSATDFTQSFRIAWERCTFTVTSLTPRSAAICLFRPPAATRATTSRSRWLRSLNLSRKVECDVFLCAPSAILFEGYGDGVEKILVPERLGKEVYGAGLDGADRHGNIAIAGEKNDRHVNFGFR